MEELCGWQGLLKVMFGVLFHLNFNLSKVKITSERKVWPGARWRE